MSYNGYNQYSPYWQQSAGQDGRGQFSDQSRNNPAYQSNTCQPLTAYQNNQQRSQSSTPQNVGNGGAGDGRSQDSRAGYGNDRSPVDTTALGNLAYASTLGRDNSSQKIPDYSRQTSTGYSSASSYGISSAPPMQYRLDHERTESSGATAASREDLTARAQQATSSPSSGYSSNNGLSGYQAYNSVANVQTSSPCSRPSRALYASTNQPSRPTSGQAMQQSRSGLGSQAAPSATMPTSQAREYQSNPSNDSDNIHGTGQTRVQTPQQSTNTTPRPPAQPTYNPANIPNRHLTHDSSKESAAKRVDGVHQSSAVEKGPISAVVEQRLNNKSSKPATPVDSQATTVDPSQVFNHIEYTRRQAAAAAETAAKKGAEEARAAASVQTQPSSQPDGASASHPQYTVQQSIERSTSNMYVGPDSAKKDQMELEMKQMIEKMRDYKAKDPSLFSQIWEQVKKGQLPQRTSSQSAQGSATSPLVTGSQNPSPNLIQSQLPLESELAVESPFPPDSDRGRFPAQRRKRGGVNGSAGRKSITPKSAAKSSTTGTRTPAVAERSLSTPDSENQSMNQTADQSQKTNTPFSNQNTEPTANASSQGRQPPQPPKPGGTYWPEHKKRALAEAAQVALTTTNLNNDKSITTQEIHELLDQNPSYTQMCEILEHRGFVIDRGQFARLLLQAVPDLGSNSATRPPANAVTPTIVAPPAATANISGIVPPANSKAWSSVAASPTPQVLEYSASTPQSFSVTATQLTSANQNNQRPGLPRDYHLVDPAYWTPEERHHHASLTNTGAAAPAKHSVQWADKIGLPNMDTRAQTPNGAAQGPMQKQPTKQEMARKRSFAEIVDLTQALSDDEDLDRRRSKPRLDDETTFSLYNNEKSVKNVLQNLTQQHSSGTSTPTSVVDRPLDQTKQNLSEQDSILQSQDIVKPMNTRRDARRRSSYNPKTIARDILLAIGKHPTMTPLNGHLEPLRQRFSAVDNESDLSTFRWDIVDPPGDTAKGRRDVDEHDADGEDDGGVPTQRSPTRPCRAPVASTVGDGHGTVQAASSARPVPRSTRGRPSSRKVNPTRGGFSVPSFRSQTKSIGSINTPQQRTTQELASASGNGNSPSINPPDLSRYVYTSPYTGQSTTTGFGIVCPSVASSALASGLDVSKKRRGRPLGAKNSKPPQPGRDTGLGPKSAKTPDANLNNIVPSPISTPSTGGLIHHSFAAPSNTGAPSTSSAKVPAKPSYGPSLSSATTANANSAQPDSSNTTPARPSGLRNYISARTPADGIAVVISRSPSAAITPHKRSRSQTGRPRKVSNALSSGRRPPPSYQIYRCLWEKCPAELHNLETLQKHVRKHRRDEGGVYPCLWADCRDSRTTVSSPSPDIKRNRLKFESEVAWDTHVKAKHINSMARKLGDGPLTHPSDAESSDHKSDTHGR